MYLGQPYAKNTKQIFFGKVYNSNTRSFDAISFPFTLRLMTHYFRGSKTDFKSGFNKSAKGNESTLWVMCVDENNRFMFMNKTINYVNKNFYS